MTQEQRGIFRSQLRNGTIKFVVDYIETIKDKLYEQNELLTLALEVLQDKIDA